MQESIPSLSSWQGLMVNTPTVYCLVNGASEGKTRLNAFDNALIDAGVGDTNLMRMSSILPPGAERRHVDEIDLPVGGLIPLAYASIDSTTPGRYISSAIAVGIPKDPSMPGVIMEFEDHSRLNNVEKIARQMVLNAFKARQRKLSEIKSRGIEHKVENCAAVFAGVVLWYQ